MQEVVAQLERLVADAFTGLAGSSGYPCLGARSVVHRGAFEIRLYSRLGTRSAAAEMARDLAAFGDTLTDDDLSSFVAVFREPGAMGERRFSHLLWQQLQELHDVDRQAHAWDPSVSADPQSPHFSFSVGGHAYFVVGLHAGSSRWARRFGWPALVFNPHSQFAAMRSSGHYGRVRSSIRGRDESLQGFMNPMLRDHGDGSEARQYAGDVVAAQWRCPLHVEPA